MTDTPWTPGPLTVRRAAKYSDCGIVSDGQYIVAEVFADIRHANENASAEAMANATLYAAAPDLAEALAVLDEVATDRAVDAPEWRDSDTVSVLLTIGELRAARAALTKARGMSA